MSDSNKTCSTCAFYRQHPVIGSRCQRYPTPVTTPMDYTCGEHSIRSTATKATKEAEGQGRTTSAPGATDATSARTSKAKEPAKSSNSKNRRTTKANPSDKK